MNILSMLMRNACRGISTLRFPARPPAGPGFRGMVHMDPGLCVGCAICRFRCTARAITFTSAKKDFTWSYDPAQCTFCGRCVEGCKEHALTQQAACPPIYQSKGALKTSYTIARKPPLPKQMTKTADSNNMPSVETSHDS